MLRYYFNPLMITVIIGMIYVFVFWIKGLRMFASKKDDETTKDMTNNELYHQILILFIVQAILIGLK